MLPLLRVARATPAADVATTAYAMYDLMENVPPSLMKCSSAIRQPLTSTVHPVDEIVKDPAPAPPSTRPELMETVMSAPTAGVNDAESSDAAAGDAFAAWVSPRRTGP
jgi:hypothetical protein